MLTRLTTLLPIIALVAVVATVPGGLATRRDSTCGTGEEYCCSQYILTPMTLWGSVGGDLVSPDGVLTCEPCKGDKKKCAGSLACCYGTTPLTNETNCVSVGATPF